MPPKKAAAAVAKKETKKTEEKATKNTKERAKRAPKKPEKENVYPEAEEENGEPEAPKRKALAKKAAPKDEEVAVIAFGGATRSRAASKKATNGEKLVYVEADEGVEVERPSKRKPPAKKPAQKENAVADKEAAGAKRKRVPSKSTDAVKPTKAPRRKPAAPNKEEAEDPAAEEPAAGPSKAKRGRTTKPRVPVKSPGKKPTAAPSDDSTDEEAAAPPRKRAAAKPKPTRKKPAAAASSEESADEEPAAAPARKQPAARAPRKAPTASKAPPKNATATSWDAIDFKCTKKNKNDAEPNLHILSWNVGGLRSCCKKDGLKVFQHADADIVCFQETKCTDEQLQQETLALEGYHKYSCASEKEGYAGVALFSKQAPIEVRYGINSTEHDAEGRCITAEFETFYLVNVYVPNAGRKLVTMPKRLDWNQIFKGYINDLNGKKPVIVCGDMNVAHQEIDLANPKTNTKNAGFTPEERAGMTEFLAEGYVDTFRHFYPDTEKAYTFWSYMFNARAKNIGWRLDYFLASERLLDQICDHVIFDKVLGSDHCPLGLFITV